MDNPPTCAQRLLTLAKSLGVDYIFSNLGSDHPAFIEGFAALKAARVPMPQVIVCPHEMTALSAAHGHAMISRRPQMVLVHVDVGTQNLGGSVHNAARGRVPAIVVAGLSPVTENAGRRGGRNEFIHDLQDAPRQQEIVAQYMKWTYELRASESVDSVLYRAVQLATTEPQGPVYLTGAREVWEDPVPESGETRENWPAGRMGGLPEDAVSELADALAASERPIAITSYLGRDREAVGKLVELSERVGIGVSEVSPTHMNFPGNHPHHLGYQRNTLVEDADLILMCDVDVPWLKSRVRPASAARIFQIDVDPVKTGMAFWHYPAQRVYQADIRQAIEQVLERLEPEPAARDRRISWIAARKASLPALPPKPMEGPITPVELSQAVSNLVGDRTRIVFEAPTATEIIPSVLKLSRPGSYFNSGGTGLGWGINAAFGAKLASPDSEVIALVGDGSYAFGIPSSTYWAASTYEAPFLTVIYNNGGWNAPKYSTLGVHPEGIAKQNDTFWATMTSSARLADVAAASGNVAAFQISDRDTLDSTLDEAMATVRAGRSAVVDVWIAPFSAQVLGRNDTRRPG